VREAHHAQLFVVRATHAAPVDVLGSHDDFGFSLQTWMANGKRLRRTVTRRPLMSSAVTMTSALVPRCGWRTVSAYAAPLRGAPIDVLGSHNDLGFSPPTWMANGKRLRRTLRASPTARPQ
jgi:hypothetical protein